MPIVISSTILKKHFPPADSLLGDKDKEYLSSLNLSVLDVKKKDRLDKKLLKIKRNIISGQKKSVETYKTGFDMFLKDSYHITLCGGRYNGKISRFWLITEKKPAHVLSDAKEYTINKLLDVWAKEGLNRAASLFNYRISAFANTPIMKDSSTLSIENIDELLDIWDAQSIEDASETFMSKTVEIPTN